MEEIPQLDQPTTSAPIEQAEPEHLDPVAVEEQIQAQIAGKDPAEAAAFLFKFYWPLFARIVDHLSSNSLRRLIKAMIAQPLEEASVNLKLPIERQAYAILEKLFLSKTLLIVDTIYKHQDKLKPFEEIESQANNTQENTTDG